MAWEGQREREELCRALQVIVRTLTTTARAGEPQEGLDQGTDSHLTFVRKGSPCLPCEE